VPGKIFIGWVILAGVLIFAQQPTPDLALDEAASAFEQGKASEAEQKVQSVLEKHPSDLRALLLAGAILDSEQRYSQAEPYHQRALKIAPRSAQVLNNVANRPRTTPATQESLAAFQSRNALSAGLCLAKFIK